MNSLLNVAPIPLVLLLASSGGLWAAEINDQVFRVMVSGCGLQNRSFVQTGFRTKVQGEPGLVTALHGVLGCNRVTATQGEMVYLDDLELAKVDIKRDMAFYSSRYLQSFPGQPLGEAPWAPQAQFEVIGYPQGCLGQLSHPARFHQQAYRELASVLPPAISSRLDLRRSPDIRTSVLWVEGAIQPGHSGAPLIATGSQTVVAVANGGLAGGAADINWAIPFADISWESAVTERARLQQLSQMETVNLFSAVDVPATQTARGARIEGTVFYNGRPACSNTAAFAAIQLMEVEKRQEVPVTVTYDNKTSKYVIQGVPPGKYTPFVRLEAGYPFYIESGGDYFSRLSGMNDDIVVAPHEELIKRDLKVVNVIHLKRPVDNQQRRTQTDDPLEVLYESFYGPSAEVFEWDAVPGAATYKVYFLLQEGDQHNVSKQKRIDYQEKSLPVPQISPKLRPTGPNQFYMFRVDALNRQGELIGVFNHYYKNGSGGWFEFVVQKKPANQ